MGDCPGGCRVKDPVNFDARVSGCRLPILAVLAASVASAAFLPSAQAQTAVLHGKLVTIYVAGGAGGGVDAYARTLAPYLGKYLPGAPTVAVSNMPGGGGMQAVQYLYNVAAKDGTAVGTTNVGPVSEPQLGSIKVNYDISKFRWVGSLAKGNTVCAFWHTSGVKTIDDVRQREFTIAATGATSAPTRSALLMNALIGTKFRPIAGYTGGTALLAIERGEVDGTCTTLNSLLTTRPQWIKENKLNILFHVAMKAEAGFEKYPVALDMVKDPEGRRALEFFLLPYEFNNPYMLPPGVSDAMLAAYRKAFDAAVADKAYLADASKRRQILQIENGARVSAYVAQMNEMPQAIIERTKAMIDPKGKVDKKKQ